MVTKINIWTTRVISYVIYRKPRDPMCNFDDKLINIVDAKVIPVMKSRPMKILYCYIIIKLININNKISKKLYIGCFVS